MFVDNVTRRSWPVYHRGPCHPCGTCGIDQCIVYNDDVHVELHLCAYGCDGVTWLSALYGKQRAEAA
jgi:hypothetical protein